MDNNIVDNNIQEDRIIFCVKCGAEMKMSSRYCMKCGALNYDHPLNASMREYVKEDKGGSEEYISLSNGSIKPQSHKTCCVVTLFLSFFLPVVFTILLLVFKAENIVSLLFSLYMMGGITFLYTYSIECIYIKANKPWWSIYVPFYGNYVFFDITLDNVATSISDMTNIPVNKLTLNEKQKIATIENTLKETIVGQDEAIENICKIIKRNKVGLGDKTKTLGNVLMLGPSGCGKTLIAKKIAEEIFGSDKDLVRIDMSEYSEKHSVAKLTGAAPGYIGFENGGQLTEAIKNKQHCVLLLDDIEKADQEVYNLILQLFDEGRLTDSSGQMVNFKNVIVLMTSNIGAKQANEMGKGLGFVNDESANKKSIIEKSLKQTFTPEFINRIDQIVYFNS